jgi:hypothetical protein
VLSQAAFRDGGSFSGAFACLVEVAPLLTPQFVVDRSRLAHHSAEAREATLPSALETCLPLTERSEPFQTIAGPQLLLLKSRSMNVKFTCGYDDPEILATRKPHAALMALTADTIAATLKCATTENSLLDDAGRSI